MPPTLPFYFPEAHSPTSPFPRITQLHQCPLLACVCRCLGVFVDEDVLELDSTVTAFELELEERETPRVTRVVLEEDEVVVLEA